MKSTKVITVRNNLVIYAVCPYCHSFVKVGDQLAFFYYCSKCKEHFGSLAFPFTAYPARFR